MPQAISRVLRIGERGSSPLTLPTLHEGRFWGGSGPAQFKLRTPQAISRVLGIGEPGSGPLTL
eukprot:8999269-Alexandrium_andersonii.AAC.1